MPPHRISILCCTLLLGFCVQIAAAQSPSPNASDPKLDAEQALRHTLELIRGIARFEDITPERVHKIYGVGLRRYGGTLSYSARISSRWQMAMSLLPKPPLGPIFQLAFHHFFIGDVPPTSEICQFGYEPVVGELMAMGFTRQGALRRGFGSIYQDFERGELAVQIYSHVYRTSGLDAAPEAFTPTCVLQLKIGTRDALAPPIPMVR